MEEWYRLSVDKAIAQIGASKNGLSSDEAERRLKKYGFNELRASGRKTILEVFISQFKSLVVLILVIAAGISIYIGEELDAAVIFAIILINASIGTYHEYRAENEIAALRKLQISKNRVLRDGKEIVLDSKFVVPGDIVLLGAGDRITADMRLIEVVRFECDESTLTGESLPVPKSINEIKKKAMIADIANMVFAGTFATMGRAKAVAVETGEGTEIGRVFSKIKEEREIFPLQKRMNAFISTLGKFALLGTLSLVAVGIYLLGYPLEEIFRLAIAQTVSFIPEGLPIVVTIALAIGIMNMATKRVITRKLPAIETIGAVSVICTDKTGTITQNHMVVRSFFANWNNYLFKDNKLFLNNEYVDPLSIPGFGDLAHVGVLCNDAADSVETKIGDPLEIAMLEFFSKFGISKEAMETENPRMGEVPFDPKNKYMMTINRRGKRITYNLKGAVEVVEKMCDRLLINGKMVHLNRKERDKILKVAEELAGKGLRTLAFAYKEEASAKERLEADYVFVGVIALLDPLRPEVRNAVLNAQEAGIKVIMITGDHKLTATSIAKEAGILGPHGHVITGYEIDSLSDSRLDEKMRTVSVCARMTTEHKLRIIESLKRLGHVVAMTGDGVNDALALKKADVAIGLGSGTEVAKEASDIIITDDNFSTIMNAVEEGRASSANIRRVIKYLFSTNIAEVIILLFILFSPFLLGTALPLALLPIHILYVNLVTDGVCDVTLATERKEKGIMKHKPAYYSKGFFTPDVIKFIFATSLITMVGVILFFVFYLGMRPLEHARTATFTLLSFFQLWSALNARSHNESIFSRGIFSNHYLTGAIVVSILIQLGVIYLPEMNAIMKTTPLFLEDWVAIIAVSSTLFFAFEVLKYADRKGIPTLSY